MVECGSGEVGRYSGIGRLGEVGRLVRVRLGGVRKLGVVGVR